MSSDFNLLVRLNSAPIIHTIHLDNGQSVFVIDDFVDQPEKLAMLAQEVKSEFVYAEGSAFPGLQLLMPPDFSARLDDFFRLHIRSRVHGRRSLSMYSRLSRVNLAPALLDARQRICHRDNAEVHPSNIICASVLYLFKDPTLGGTVFFQPRVSDVETEQLVHDASRLEPGTFESRYDWPPAYMTQSNRYFEVIGRVPALWNRAIFYDGSIFHSSDILHPEKLTEQTGMGRLTINGFFTCTRRAS